MTTFRYHFKTTSGSKHDTKVTVTDGEIRFIGKGRYGWSDLDLDDKFIKIIHDIRGESSSLPGYDIKKHLEWRNTDKSAFYDIPISAGIIIRHVMSKGFSTFYFFDQPAIMNAVVKMFFQRNNEFINFFTEKERCEAEKKYEIDLSTGEEISYRHLLYRIITDRIKTISTELKDKLIDLLDDEGRSKQRLSENEKRDILIRLFLEFHKNHNPHYAFFNSFFKFLSSNDKTLSTCIDMLIMTNVFDNEYVEICRQISPLIANKIFTINDILQLNNDNFKKLSDSKVINNLKNNPAHIHLLGEPFLASYVTDGHLTCDRALTILEDTNLKPLICCDIIKNLIYSKKMTINEAFEQKEFSKLFAHAVFINSYNIPRLSIIANAESDEERMTVWESYQQKIALAMAIYPKFCNSPTGSFFITADQHEKPAARSIVWMIANFLWVKPLNFSNYDSAKEDYTVSVSSTTPRIT